MVDSTQLRDALARWSKAGPTPLLSLLGFQPLGQPVPQVALADFGLQATLPLTLEIAARHRSFYVFRITLRNSLDSETIRRTSAALYRHNPTRRALLIFQAADTRVVFASWGLGPGPFRLLKLWVDLQAPRHYELDILAGLATSSQLTPSELALSQLRALDRETVTQKFFTEFRRQRSQLAAAFRGLPEGARQDRLDLALILLGRLLFLYFLQRKGWLAGDDSYLRNLYEDSLSQSTRFFRLRLQHLFFGALNRPADRRSRQARELGRLPYLNGGLFQRALLERKYPRLDVHNDDIGPVFSDLLDKYQFTLREGQPTDQDVAVDPEMLGKVFEGLMATPERGSTGAFFTPRNLVQQIVDSALRAYLAEATGSKSRLIEDLIDGSPIDIDARSRAKLTARVRSVRVLDPAVGSGAFLLATLYRLETLRDLLEGSLPDSTLRFQRRLDIIRRNLHGVDVNGAAVRLCELRLWLALVVDLEVDSIEQVPTLPNLDANIRQGDVLLDPLDFLLQLGDLDYGALASRWNKAAKRLTLCRDRYFDGAGIHKKTLERRLRRAEVDLALNFLGELARQIDHRLSDLQAMSRSRDLFGARTGLTKEQRRRAILLRERRREASNLIRRIKDHGDLPFFSFPVHFPDSRQTNSAFQLVLGNPPWVRTHLWSGHPRQRLRERYTCLREAGWRLGSRLAGAGRGFSAQLDLSTLFLERSLELLAPKGALGFLLPAKLARGLSASAMREKLLVGTRIQQVDDYSATATRLFEATTYPMALTLTRQRPHDRHRVSVRLHDPHHQSTSFRLTQAQLPLVRDAGAPWVLAPPPVRKVFDRMHLVGPPLGSRCRPTRGVFTGCNSVFVGKLSTGGPATGAANLVLPAGPAAIEVECLRPTLRGEDLSPWRFKIDQALIWTHDDGGYVRPALPTATLAHLASHRQTLLARVDLRPGQPFWAIFRAREEKWGLRVAWRDIAPAPSAVVVPPRAEFLCGSVPIISLNTVYQLPAASEEEAHLLAAVLNSTVARAYLKAIAERAAGGYFRFLGWTVALLPFPEKPDAAAYSRCVRLSRRAHVQGSLDPAQNKRLDEAVADLYRLDQVDLSLLTALDALLSKNEISR
ncbi:MAG: hypothetical protein JSU87_06680 [Gemmatimonadota bacterium]|nr:MAG: hypothetical protein JSU87_06680 [Gemmatimonadota bacterium]